jgi:hypothetical protein
MSAHTTTKRIQRQRFESEDLDAWIEDLQKEPPQNDGEKS